MEEMRVKVIQGFVAWESTDWRFRAFGAPGPAGAK